ncbi:hypothetical protein BC835DRAFT_259626 [Cytidiella melzeri]|nr:hypothetical protein BC835DRAFT_259626 [Cytidiella melzeri]
MVRRSGGRTCLWGRAYCQLVLYLTWDPWTLVADDCEHLNAELSKSIRQASRLRLRCSTGLDVNLIVSTNETPLGAG